VIDFVALGVQHAMRMCHIAMCGPFGLNIIFPHYLINSTTLKRKVNEHKMCVLTFSINFVRNISHSRKNSERYYHKCTFVFMFLSDSCQILIELQLSGEIFEKPLNITVHEIFSVGAEFFHTDRRTDEEGALRS